MLVLMLVLSEVKLSQAGGRSVSQNGTQDGWVADLIKKPNEREAYRFGAGVTIARPWYYYLLDPSRTLRCNNTSPREGGRPCEIYLLAMEFDPQFRSRPTSLKLVSLPVPEPIR